MCWIPLTLGALMMATGTVLVVGYFSGRGKRGYALATPARTESMILGVALISIGFLALALGITGVICERLGWS